MSRLNLCQIGSSIDCVEKTHTVASLYLVLYTHDITMTLLYEWKDLKKKGKKRKKGGGGIYIYYTGRASVIQARS